MQSLMSSKNYISNGVRNCYNDDCISICKIFIGLSFYIIRLNKIQFPNQT